MIFSIKILVSQFIVLHFKQGKFIRVWFNNQGKMAGGDIETYLLEKSRVTYQSPMERCYHIFYFLITHKVDLHEYCKLTDDIYDYPCVSMGKVLVESIDDVEEMEIMDVSSQPFKTGV